MKNLTRSRLAWAALTVAIVAGSLVAQDNDPVAQKTRLLGEAIKAREEGNLQGALDKYEQLLQLDPKDEAANEGKLTIKATLASAEAEKNRAAAAAAAAAAAEEAARVAEEARLRAIEEEAERQLLEREAQERADRLKYPAGRPSQGGADDEAKQRVRCPGGAAAVLLLACWAAAACHPAPCRCAVGVLLCGSWPAQHLADDAVVPSGIPAALVESCATRSLHRAYDMSAYADRPQEWELAQHGPGGKAGIKHVAYRKVIGPDGVEIEVEVELAFNENGNPVFPEGMSAEDFPGYTANLKAHQGSDLAALQAGYEAGTGGMGGGRRGKPQLGPDGEPLMVPTVGPDGKPLLDEHGNPVMVLAGDDGSYGASSMGGAAPAAEMLLGPDGEPLMVPLLDANGNPVLDEFGNLIMTPVKAGDGNYLLGPDGKPLMQPLLDANGNPLLDENGNPIMVPIDGSGMSAAEVEAAAEEALAAAKAAAEAAAAAEATAALRAERLANGYVDIDAYSSYFGGENVLSQLRAQGRLHQGRFARLADGTALNVTTHHVINFDPNATRVLVEDFSSPRSMGGRSQGRSRSISPQASSPEITGEYSFRRAPAKYGPVALAKTPAQRHSLPELPPTAPGLLGSPNMHTHTVAHSRGRRRGCGRHSIEVLRVDAGSPHLSPDASLAALPPIRAGGLSPPGAGSPTAAAGGDFNAYLSAFHLPKSPPRQRFDVLTMGLNLAGGPPGNGNGAGKAGTSSNADVLPLERLRPTSLVRTMRALPDTRAYLESAVLPMVRDALRAANEERPEDPLLFIGRHLIHSRTHLLQMYRTAVSDGNFAYAH